MILILILLVFVYVATGIASRLLTAEMVVKSRDQVECAFQNVLKTPSNSGWLEAERLGFEHQALLGRWVLLCRIRRVLRYPILVRLKSNFLLRLLLVFVAVASSGLFHFENAVESKPSVASTNPYWAVDVQHKQTPLNLVPFGSVEFVGRTMKTRKRRGSTPHPALLPKGKRKTLRSES